MPTKTEQKTFEDQIIQLSKKHNIDTMDAILVFCETTGMEIETVSKLVSKDLKLKLFYEAKKLNMLK